MVWLEQMTWWGKVWQAHGTSFSQIHGTKNDGHNFGPRWLIAGMPPIPFAYTVISMLEDSCCIKAWNGEKPLPNTSDLCEPEINFWYGKWLTEIQLLYRLIYHH